MFHRVLFPYFLSLFCLRIYIAYQITLFKIPFSAFIFIPSPERVLLARLCCFFNFDECSIFGF